jgi:phosphoenolpyruvate-protein phosphotransferase (PTS system enzyme I)
MTEQPTTSANLILEGVPASSGIAIGPVRIIKPDHAEELEHRILDPEDVQLEIERLRAALKDADRELEHIETLTRDEVEDPSGIFEALRMILRDPALVDAIEQHMLSGRVSAHAAVVAEMTRLAEVFTRSTDVTLRSRAEDLKALQSHLIACLSNSPLPSGVHHDAVLVMPHISPRDTVVYARGRAAAFVMEVGGINSHAAILARSFGVPMVAGVRDVTHLVEADRPIIVDGYTGRVIVNPDPEMIAQYRTRKASLEQQRERYRDARDLPAETADGERVVIAANLDMIDEIEATIENGADEIGLMRTEYLVMGRDGDISMEEQLQYYRQIAERAYPMTVTFRAFDIGSDKLAGEIWGRGDSPLGLRGTRLLLIRQEVLRRQLEALLRASSTKNIRLMLPMVTSVDEVRHVKRIVEEIRVKLRAQKVAFDEYMPIGTMIEVPAAALTAETLAGESAFLSLGTNDLAQYALAVDREDEALDAYYDELHPGVLRLIRHTIIAARRCGVPATICGELAANPLATGLLIGLGIRRFSVPPLQIAPLKMRVRAITTHEAFAWARAALRMASASEVRAYLASCNGGGEGDF